MKVRGASLVEVLLALGIFSGYGLLVLHQSGQFYRSLVYSLHHSLAVQGSLNWQLAQLQSKLPQVQISPEGEVSWQEVGRETRETIIL